MPSRFWRGALVVAVVLVAAGLLWVAREVGAALILGALLGAAWRGRSQSLPILWVLVSPVIALATIAVLPAVPTPQQSVVVLALATMLLCVGAFFCGRVIGWTIRRAALCAASAPMFVLVCAAVVFSYLPDSAALRDQVVRRYEVAWQLVSSDRFSYAGTVAWDDCLGPLSREDQLTLSYDHANALDERQRTKGGAGLEQILGAQLPGGMRVVREWTDIRVSRTRREKDLVPYWAGDAVRWPLPAASRWVGSVRVPTIRRSDRLLLPAQDAVMELRAPAGCIASTFPRPTTVERSSHGDRFLIPVGRPAISLHAAAHLGQDPYTVSLALTTPAAQASSWIVGAIDWSGQWPAAAIALLMGLLTGFVLAAPRRTGQALLTAPLTNEVAF